MATPKKIVVIGSTGHFGGRICRRIVGEHNTELIVSSRRLASARALADELSQLDPGASVSAASLDHAGPDFEEDLALLKPDIVVHTAGPYQGQDYRVAKACVRCGSHYIDLADGRSFVEGFDRLHEQACAQGVLLVSGASTLPGLSSAVINHLQDRFGAISEIEISIAPAHQTPRGSSTVEAVLSYCGKPFTVLVDGQWINMHGWQNMRKLRYPKLGTRLGGACDVPDLGLLPNYIAGCRTVTFHAALEAAWEQAALWLMASCTRLGLIRNWTRLTASFQWLSERLINLGSATGGMHIRLSGTDADQNALSVDWFLTAHQNHGPEIPCSPALVLARKLAAGKISKRGAFPCLGLFTLDEFDVEVRDLDIDWTIDTTADL